MAILDSFLLHEKTAVVTGAGSGLGRAIAMALAECGARVACWDIVSERSEDTAQVIRDRGGTARSCVVDTGSPEQVEQAARETRADLGPAGILFHVAGIAGAGVRLHELAVDEWRRRQAVNLDGAFLTSRAVLPGMLEIGEGVIVLTASIWGFLASGMHPVPDYAAAKGAILNLTRELAIEYAPSGIRVNAIAPGFFRTNLTPRIQDEAYRRELAARIPLGRMGLPDEIAGLAVFLASPASAYITGQAFVIDGGFSCV